MSRDFPRCAEMRCVRHLLSRFAAGHPPYEVLVTRLVIGQAQQRTFDSCSCVCVVALNGFEEAIAFLKTPFGYAGSYSG